MANIYGEKSNIKVQWEKVKDGTPQQKFDWFVTYFGLYAVIGVALVALIIFLVVSSIKSNKPRVISGLFLDLYSAEDTNEALRLKMCEAMDLDTSKYAIDITSLYSDTENISNLYSQQQSVFARVAAKELDVIALTEANVSTYFDETSVDTSVFDPLSNYLSADLLKKLEAEGRIVYRTPSGQAATAYFI